MMMTTNKQGSGQPQGFGFKPDEFRYYKASLDCEKIKDLLLAEPCRNDLEKEELLCYLRSAQISICNFFLPISEEGPIVFADIFRRYFPKTKPPSEEQGKVMFLRYVDTITGLILNSLGAFNDGDKIAAWKETAKVNFMVGVMCEEKSSSLRIQKAESIRKEDASKLGRISIQKRHAPMAKLRSWAIEKYKEKTWKSANQAAHALKDEILKYGESIGARLSESNAQVTIAQWIRKQK
jgi:hypothetical protein